MSVARLMPSISECRQPYLLSNLLLVTESLTLMAGNEQRAVAGHLVEPVHTGRGLLGDALDPGGDGASSAARPRSASGCSTSSTTAYSSEVESSGAGHDAGRLELDALVHQQRRVAAVVEDHVRPAAVRPAQDLLGAPPVLARGSRPSRRTPGRPAGASGVPFGPTAIAAAAWSWVE